MSLIRAALCFGVMCIFGAGPSSFAGAPNPSSPPGRPVTPSFFMGNPKYPLAPRRALVIGVAKLKDDAGFQTLKNPEHDAAAVSAALKRAHFIVTNLDDIYKPEQMTRQNVKKEIYDFSLKLRASGGVGLIYFSGHGVERNGNIYVAPYDAYVRFERDLQEELIPIQLFYDAFSYAGNPFNILVIDACRDNPWTKGLAHFGNPPPPPKPVRPKDVILLTSTLSGGKALDGSDNESPYAQAFVTATKEPDLGLADFFGEIVDSVAPLTENSDDLTQPALLLRGRHDFVFHPTAVTFRREQQIYRDALAARSRQTLLDFTRRFAGGYFYQAALKVLHSDKLPVRKAELSPSSVMSGFASGTDMMAGAAPHAVPFAFPGAGKIAKNGISTFGYHENIDKFIAAPTWGSTNVARLNNNAFMAPYSGRFAVPDINAKVKTIALQFVPSAQVGLEDLAPVSRQSITDLSKDYAPTLTSVRVVGYRYTGPARKNANAFRLLGREAKAIRALAELGYDSPSIVIADRDTKLKEKEDAVEVIMTERKPPPVPSPARPK